MRIQRGWAILGMAIMVPSQGRGQGTRPVVQVVATGGTIASAGAYWTGKATRVPITDLLHAPGLDTIATVTAEQLWNVPSGSIGPDRWMQLSRHVDSIFARQPALAGVVVTHGTDTMEETAYFLDLTVHGERPVIVTGAMRPSDMAGADGPANFASAVRAAADPAARGRGTMVLMDDRLFAARDVTKTNSTRVETFQAPESGPLAIVDPEGLFYRRPSPHRATPRFELAGVARLPRVDVVYSYGGADGVAIDAFVAAGARGLVLAGIGRGGMTADQRDALLRAQSRGVIVVLSTRTGAGHIPGSAEDRFIGAGDLNPQKARVLLSLALTRTSDRAAIARFFDETP